MNAKNITNMDTFLPPIEKPSGADDEVGVLLYAPPIWQSAYAAEGAFGAVAGCISYVLWEGRQTRQKADVAAGDCAAHP